VPAAGDRDLQPQPVAQPLKALQDAVLGHCETCGLAQRIRPAGAARPSPSRLAVGDRGASWLSPKIKVRDVSCSPARPHSSSRGGLLEGRWNTVTLSSPCALIARQLSQRWQIYLDRTRPGK
jgi:hypothetical protein